MRIMLIIGAILLGLVTFLNFYKNLNSSPYVIINNKTFKIEVAKTEEQKAKGLAKYDKISNDFGMLFPFQKPDYYAFWMKDMKFPIDIIYIHKNKIVYTFSNVKNPTSSLDLLPILRPNKPANMVFEINAGLSNKYGFKNGDNVKINY